MVEVQEVLEDHPGGQPEHKGPKVMEDKAVMELLVLLAMEVFKAEPVLAGRPHTEDLVDPVSVDKELMVALVGQEELHGELQEPKVLKVMVVQPELKAMVVFRVEPALAGKEHTVARLVLKAMEASKVEPVSEVRVQLALKAMVGTVAQAGKLPMVDLLEFKEDMVEAQPSVAREATEEAPISAGREAMAELQEGSRATVEVLVSVDKGAMEEAQTLVDREVTEEAPISAGREVTEAVQISVDRVAMAELQALEDTEEFQVEAQEAME